MARLIYATNASLDGYINDADGDFDWSVPDESLHDYFAELVASSGTFLYGRRLHETMRVWDEWHGMPDLEPPMHRFADAWAGADKIVFSRTLDDAGIARSRVEREFDPARVREWVREAARDLMIGGAELAGHAFRAGLIDEVQIAVHPVMVGAGTPALPAGVRLDLRMVESRAFPGGAVLLRYAVGS